MRRLGLGQLEEVIATLHAFDRKSEIGSQMTRTQNRAILETFENG
jgi:hypothetical protein